MHALIVGNADKHIDDISSAQLEPFFHYRRLLKKQAGFTFEHLQAYRPAEVTGVLKNAPTPDAIFLRPDWRTEPKAMTALMAWIRERHPESRLIFMDPWDQTSSRFFGVLPHVDKFLKFQRLKDTRLYLRRYVGGTLITDFFANYLGYSFHGWDVSSTVEPGLETRIDNSWNFALARKYRKVIQQSVRHQMAAFDARPIDIFCHLSLGKPDEPNSWYARYRKQTLATLTPLEKRHKLAMSGDYFGHRTVSSKQYQHDIRNSKIVVSPYGWGEITWRDYEAACHACLLIKPSVEHVTTTPDIFVAGETYVPVRWDLSDLEQKCEYYLDHPDEAETIADNLYQAYRRYFTENRFVNTVQDILAQTPAGATAA